MNYAFIVHLRSFPDDIRHVLPIPKWVLPVLGLFKPLVLLILWGLKGRMGFSVKSKFKIGETRGFIVLVWLTGQQIMDQRKAHQVRQRVLDAVLYAQNSLGCQVIGLGALTSSVTKAGEWVVNQPEVTAAITHGDSYAAAVGVQGIRAVCLKTGLELSKAKIAIVGATGLIGEALALSLSPMVKGLVLVGRKENALKDLRSRLNEASVTIATDIIDVKESDVVVMATNSVGAILRKEHLKQRAIVYDLSQPRNTSPILARERPDVLIVDGSLTVVPPGIRFWWMSLPPNTTFACMAETTMQALTNDREDHVGRISLAFARETVERARKHGISHAPFSSFGKRIPEKRFSEIKGATGEHPAKVLAEQPAEVRG